MSTAKNRLLHLSNETRHYDNSINEDIIIDYIAVDTGNNVYSILVTSSDKNSITYEYVFLYDVTRNFELAEKLLKMLCDNLVTPCSVSDVVYDYLNTFT